jgi:hypothetical protein
MKFIGGDPRTLRVSNEQLIVAVHDHSSAFAHELFGGHVRLSISCADTLESAS